MTETFPENEMRLAVLRELREDGRMSFSRIADSLGTTRRQVAGIVQRAIEQHDLRLTVSISPDLLGLERFAYTQLSVSGPVAPVREALVAMPETTFVADISGRYAIDAEIRVGKDPHLRDTLDALQRLPGVTQTRTHIYESIEINLYSPLRTGRSAIAVDEVDLTIVRHLQDDGRASFRDLSAMAGVSPSGARFRLKRLMDHDTVKVVGIPVRGSRSETPSLGVGIQANGNLDQTLTDVKQLDPEFLSITLGEYDLIATLSADTYDELIDLAERLRSLHSVNRVETWANLRILKEQYGEGDQITATVGRS